MATETLSEFQLIEGRSPTDEGIELLHSLERKRKEAGLTREDVASYLHLSLKVVAALEENRFDDLPEPAYTKGYIRAYARLLRLDAQPYVDAYSKLGISDPSYVSAPRIRYEAEHHAGVRWGTLAVVLMLVGLLTAWWINERRDVGTDVAMPAPAAAGSGDVMVLPVPGVSDGESAALSSELALPKLETIDSVAAISDVDLDSTATAALQGATTSATEAREEIGGVSVPAAIDVDSAAVSQTANQNAGLAESQGVAESEGAPAPVQTGAADQTADELASASSDVASTIVSAGTDNTPTTLAASDATPTSTPVESSIANAPVANNVVQAAADPFPTVEYSSLGQEAVGNDTLHLEFVEPSWVEIYDANSVRVLYGLIKPDSVRNLRGTAPFQLLIGNAHGVVVKVNDKPYDHTRHIRLDKTARFTIGEPAAAQ